MGALVDIGLFCESHDTGVCAIGGGGNSAHLERGTCIQDATADGLARCPLDLQWLAGKRRFVQHGYRFADSSVCGYDLARPNDQPIADLHLGHGHLCHQ